jgi:septin family protein
MAMEIDDKELAFLVPARIYICGATGAGKTCFILNLLKYVDKMFDQPFSKIYFSVPGDVEPEFEQRLRSVAPNIKIVSGLPDFSEVSAYAGHKLVLVDDQIATIVGSKEIFNAITIASNHQHISLVITTQNFYLQGKYSKTLHRNTSYKVLFRDRGDRQWLNTFSSQMFGNKTNFLTQAMDFVVQHVHNIYDHYLVVDNSPRSTLPSNMLVKTNIFPNKDGVIEPIFFEPQL